jgi:pyridoxal phosphate enzyme (YggS family)
VTTIAENLLGIEDRIAAACRRAGRPREEVALMAVSKTHPASTLLEAISAGVTLFGENRVQEYQQKCAEIAGSLATRQIRVHLIGKLQSNKSAKAAEIFSEIDSLDSLKLAQRLNEAADRLSRKLPVLLEIKLSHEESKSGFTPDSAELSELLERLADFSNLQPRGLMTVPPWSEDPESARPYFVQLRQLRDRLASAYTQIDFSQLSMGMSGDFEVAIEEGSTCVRIGTALFGKRAYPATAEEP